MQRELIMFWFVLVPSLPITAIILHNHFTVKRKGVVNLGFDKIVRLEFDHLFYGYMV